MKQQKRVYPGSDQEDSDEDSFTNINQTKKSDTTIRDQLLHSPETSEQEELGEEFHRKRKINTNLVDIAQIQSQMLQVQLDIFSSRKNQDQLFKEFKQRISESLFKLMEIKRFLSYAEVKKAAVLEQKLEKLVKKVESAIGAQKKAIQEEKKKEDKRRSYLQNFERNEKNIHLSNGCDHSFDRNWLKQRLRQETEGTYFYHENDQNFKLVKCPQNGCLKLLTEQEEQEAFQEIQYYAQRKKNKPPKVFKKCVICGSNKLVLEGCNKHRLCDDCYQENEKKYMQCPAFGCEWRYKS